MIEMNLKINKESKRTVKTFLIVFVLFSLIYGCCTTSINKRSDQITDNRKKEKKGFYHIVKKGETLTMIAEKYNANPDNLAKLNHLPDKNKVEPEQLIFIPKSFKIYQDIDDKTDFIWPVRGKVTSLFQNDKDKGNINLGIDIEVPINSQIVASKDGEVVFCNDESLNSEVNNKKPTDSPDKKIIIIKHLKNFSSVYIYDGILNVTIGQNVFQGKTLLFPKRKADTPKVLHFEIRKQHIPQNPYYFLP